MILRWLIGMQPDGFGKPIGWIQAGELPTKGSRNFWAETRQFILEGLLDKRCQCGAESEKLS